MSQSRSSVARFVSIFITAILSGCFSTTLPELTFPAEASRLFETTDVSIPLTVHPTAWNDLAGYQYLLVALPFSRVYAPAAVNALATQVAIDAAMRGYRLEPGSVAHRGASLDITVADISVSGYDLLVVRRPSAAVTVRGTLMRDSHPARSCEVQGSTAMTKSYAFDSELNAALRGAINDASRKLLDCLRL